MPWFFHRSASHSRYDMLDSTSKNLRYYELFFPENGKNQVEFNAGFGRSQALPQDPVRPPQMSRNFPGNFPEILYIVLRNLYIVPDHFIYSSEKFIYSSNTKLKM